MAQWEFNRSAALLERLGVAGQADVVNLYAARAARGFGDGFAAIILPAYLLEIGFNPLQIGLVATAALLGSAATTLAIGFLAPRYHLRTLLLACAALMVVTGIAIPSFQHFVFIAAIAFIGTMNPTTGDIGVHVPLEQAALAHGVSDQDRTHVFARYSLIGALSIAAGALAAGAPDLLVSLGMGRIGALQAMFYVYAALRGRRGQRDGAARHRSGALAPNRLQARRALQPGFVCGRLHRSIAHGALAVRALRSLARRSERVLLLVERAHRPLLSGRGAAGQTLRPRQHHGFHPYPLERLSHSRGLLAEPHHRARAAAGALRALADGRADAHVLRHGGGDPRRADGGRERDRGPAQLGIGDQSGALRRPPIHVVCGIAARRLRRAEDRLRPLALVFVSTHQAAGREGRAALS